MKALLQKDRAWIVGWSIAGCIALAGSLAEHRFLEVFVLPAGRHEAVFHVAWIAGLLLGLTAACFDEVLGVREYLRQRPTSSQRIMHARLVGLGIVLASWFVLAPTLYLLAMFVSGETYGPVRFAAFFDIWASLVVALPASAIGLCAGLLPAPWWLRLLAAAAWLIGSVGLVGAFARGPEWYDDVPAFVGGHLVMAMVFVAAGLLAAAHGSALDADRPWPQQARRWLAGLGTVALAIVGGAVLVIGELVATSGLRRAYPSLVVHDGAVRLADSPKLRERRLQFVDREHRPQGPALPLTDGGIVLSLPDRGRLFLGPGLDAPRWQRGVHSRWVEPASYVHLGPSGEAWLQVPASRTRQLERVGPEGGMGAFEPGAQFLELGTNEDRLLLVHEPLLRRLHRFDGALAKFVPLLLPGGDRFVKSEQVGVAVGSSRSSLTVLRGERARYRSRHGEIVVLPEAEVVPLESFSPRPATFARRLDGDSVSFTITIDAAADRAAFTHSFMPRQPAEMGWAAVALACAACCPPALLVVAHLLPPGERTTDANLDPLVAGGNRLGLVSGGLAVGLLCAALATRRLRRLGAPRATWQYWAVLNVLLGPAALLASLAFERPRAYRTLPPLGAIEPPRIQTPPVATEIPA